MKKSRSVLSWVDYDMVDEGREKRNNLAHKVSLVSKSDCLKYMSLVELELLSWGILDAWTWWEYRSKVMQNNSPRAEGPFYRGHKEQGHLTLEKVEDIPKSINKDADDFVSYYWRPLHGYKVADEFIGFPPEKHKK